MDVRLKDRLDKWHRQIDIVFEAEEIFLNMKGMNDIMEAELSLSQEGDSMTEKKFKAKKTKDWKDFIKGKAKAESYYNKQKRLLDIKIKAYEAEYLECKREHEAMMKGM